MLTNYGRLNGVIGNAIQLLVPLLTVTILLACGCRSIGPGSVQRDRLHYSTAVADSWKEQLLLNIVKTRYADAPAFLEVVSVVSGYTLERGISANGEFSPENLRGDTFVGGELSGKFTDRPTISYMPMTGEKYARSLMSPLQLETLLFVIEGGEHADFILGLMLESLEGYSNRSLLTGVVQMESPQFTRVVQLIRVLQEANALETEITGGTDVTENWLRFHTDDSTDSATSESLSELKVLLGIPEHLNRVKVAFTRQAEAPEVIGMRTRSLMQILATLGTGVQFQMEDIIEGEVVPVEASQMLEGFRVHSGRDKPANAFAAVPYRGLWFWIEHRDLDSKMKLATVTLLFNFLEAGGAGSSPVLTIPIN